MKFVTDQKLKSYFLGVLVREDAERLEDECAADAELSELANIVESELSDAYLRSNLSIDERRSYEKNYLTTEARREKLRMADNLWKIAAEVQCSAKMPEPSFWQTLFANRRLLVFGSLAALIICAGLLIVRLNLKQTPEIAESQDINQSFSTETKNHSDGQVQNTNSSDFGAKSNVNSENFNFRKSNKSIAPKQNPEPETRPITRKSAPLTPATFILTPGTLRSEGEQSIKILPKTNQINLQLTVPKDAAQYQNYRAVLQTADGEIVYASPSRQSPEIFLPAAKLKNQVYVILLEGKNSADSAESVAEYTFRVSR